MPEELCPKCGKMGYRNWLFNATSFRCDGCSFHEPAHSAFPYSQEDFRADVELLESVYGSDDASLDWDDVEATDSSDPVDYDTADMAEEQREQPEPDDDGGD